jgi:hypothetical protein
MRHTAADRARARTEARPDTGLPASDPGDCAPIRRMVGLTGLALAPGAPTPAAVEPARDQPGANLGALRRQAAQHGGPVIRRMKVDGADVPSSVSGTTSTKHVMALAGQAADAQAGYGSRTFVTSDAILTAAVDADGHDFPAGAARSARHDCRASVPIYQYDKTGAPPAGLAAGQPVNKSIDGVATTCEIGAVKTGAGDISITHFKKV